MNYPGPIVDTAWLHANIDDPAVRVIDARQVDYYLAGTLPGATNLDTNLVRLRESSPAAIEQFISNAGEAVRLAGLNGGEVVVFVEDISGTLAARGVWLLDAIGHGGGTMLDGGLRAWLAGGGHLEPPTAQPEPGTFEPVLAAAVVATVDELVAGGTSGELEIIDTRADQEWLAGTVPAAVHVEWTRNLDRNGQFLPLAELRQLYAASGITGAKPVAAFCGSGFRAANTYVVLKALGIPATNYAPSWGEWSRRSDLPVTQPTR